MNKSPITPGQIIGWSFASVFVAILATALGQTVSYPTNEWTLVHFTKGIIMMLIAGFAGATIVGWIRDTLFGKESKKDVSPE